MRVLMLTGGGISNRSGGVGTMMAALIEQWGPAVCARVIDTRGQGGVISGAFVFAGALVQLLAARQIDVVHLHMTTRGSMVRKCLVLAVCSVMRRPAIVHMHGADFENFHASLRPVWQGFAGVRPFAGRPMSWCWVKGGGGSWCDTSAWRHGACRSSGTG